MGRKSFQNRLATRVSKADKAIDQGFRKVTKRLKSFQNRLATRVSKAGKAINQGFRKVFGAKRRKSFQNRLATRVSKAGKAINRELEAGHHRNSRTKALREKPSLRQHSPALRGVPENGTNARRAQPAARNSPQPVVTRPRQPVKPFTLPKIPDLSRLQKLQETLRAAKNENVAILKRIRERRNRLKLQKLKEQHRAAIHEKMV